VEATATEKVCHIRERIADRIGQNRFRTWFGDSTRFTLEGNQLGVHVSSPFVSSWITANFMEHLVEATRAVLGSEPRVAVQVVTPPRNAPAVAPVEVPRPQPVSPQRDAAPAAVTLRGDLDTLVVGPANQLAYSAARTLIEHPGETLRLLVLHGGCGLGKTHILQGICNGVRRAHPALHWRYISGEEFTNAFVSAVKSGRVDLFRARFRKVDVLVIDDIHFLANKRATQEEFLHTFNAIEAAGKAIVLSSDRHPRSITTLAEPLTNRLIAGMVVEITAPDFSMRREILRRRAALMQVTLPDEVLDFVARRVTRNVRALEGALYKLVALASLTREPFGLALARMAVDDYVDTHAAPEAEDIERVVANYFGVSREAVHSKLRDRTTSLARAVTMYLLRNHTQMSFPEIGRTLGKKNHSTVLMAVRRMEHILEQNGAVSWSASSGLREVPLQDVLQTLEHEIMQAARTSA
jgi:chromosomal replication initiator protein